MVFLFTNHMHERYKKKRDLIGAIKEKGKTLEAEMSFFDHIDVLRKHLLRGLAVVVLFTVGAFWFSDFIFSEIIMAKTSRLLDIQDDV